MSTLQHTFHINKSWYTLSLRTLSVTLQQRNWFKGASVKGPEMNPLGNLSRLSQDSGILDSEPIITHTQMNTFYLKILSCIFYLLIKYICYGATLISGQL